MHFRIIYLLISPLLINVVCFPLIHHSQNLTQEDDDDYDYEFYDQRQNGTENYRINVNGVVFFLAPLQSLLGMPSLIDSEHTDEENVGGTDSGSTAKPNTTVNANNGMERKYKVISPKPERNIFMKPKVFKLKQYESKRTHG